MQVRKWIGHKCTSCSKVYFNTNEWKTHVKRHEVKTQEKPTPPDEDMIEKFRTVFKVDNAKANRKEIINSELKKTSIRRKSH